MGSSGASVVIFSLLRIPGGPAKCPLGMVCKVPPLSPYSFQISLL